jgi:hypothetical protein
MAGESVSREGALAVVCGAEEGLLAVAVHGVGFPLVAEQTRRRGEPGVAAALDLAAVGLQVGIDTFAVRIVSW